jgi:hypothetical protein
MKTNWRGAQGLGCSAPWSEPMVDGTDHRRSDNPISVLLDRAERPYSSARILGRTRRVLSRACQSRARVFPSRIAVTSQRAISLVMDADAQLNSARRNSTQKQARVFAARTRWRSLGPIMSRDTIFNSVQSIIGQRGQLQYHHIILISLHVKKPSPDSYTSDFVPDSFDGCISPHGMGAGRAPHEWGY